MEESKRKACGIFKKDNIFSIFESCELTWFEKYLATNLHPVVTKITKNFCIEHNIRNTHPFENNNTHHILSYRKKMDSLIELLEPCKMFLQNYLPWSEQRIETIQSLLNVEKPLKELVTIYHPILMSLGPKFPLLLPNLFVNLLNPKRRFSETQKKALEDLKSEVEENRNNALRMCAVDLNLLHELGAWKFYCEISCCINDLFSIDISHEILYELLQLLNSLPARINNVEDFYNLFRIFLESLLPKISTLLSKDFSISTTILTIFIVLFITHRQSCAILINGQNLGILNSLETEVAKLLTSAHVKGTKLEKIISSEMEKKIAFGAVDNIAIILEMATIILNSIDVNDKLLFAEMQLIVQITNKLETDLASYEKVYDMLEKSSKETLKMRDITNWTTVIIYHVPTGSNQTEIKSSVKRFLREKAKDCIDLERLPTNGNNWLLKVPTNHCRALLKEKYINIDKVKCLVMP